MAWWYAAGGAALVAVLAGFGDRRRRNRVDPDRVGWVDWPGVQVFALIAAVACAVMASHA